MRPEVMNTFESRQEVVDAAGLACARKLAKWFGSEQDAIKALEEAPVAMMEIALAAFIKDQRQLTLAVHMDPQRFSRLVLSQFR